MASVLGFFRFLQGLPMTTLLKLFPTRTITSRFGILTVYNHFVGTAILKRGHVTLLPSFQTCYYGRERDLEAESFGTKYPRMDQVKFFRGCLPQILLGSFLNA